MRTCSIKDCGRIHHGHGLCRMHCGRVERSGDPRGTLKRGGAPVLTYPKLRRIDAWFASGHRHIKVLAAELGVAARTIYAARNRLGAYRDCAR